MADLMQPIIRGIQSVGSVQILYRYNTPSGDMPIPPTIKLGTGENKVIKTAPGGAMSDKGIPVAGFRLDSEFLRANPQIASSFVIPILGGGGVALTNNNRTGTLSLVCAKVSTPVSGNTVSIDGVDVTPKKDDVGSMFTPTGSYSAIGVLQNDEAYYDMVTLAQIQQGQEAGDSVGSTITINFKFCGLVTAITFEGCTIATVDPIGLAGNDAVNYAIAVNYLNWIVNFSDSDGLIAKAELNTN